MKLSPEQATQVAFVRQRMGEALFEAGVTDKDLCRMAIVCFATAFADVAEVAAQSGDEMVREVNRRLAKTHYRLMPVK